MGTKWELLVKKIIITDEGFVHLHKCKKCGKEWQAPPMRCPNGCMTEKKKGRS